MTCCYYYRMLAYRCEDINKRLEPQELFTRKEQEQTLQLDVSTFVWCTLIMIYCMQMF